MFRILPVFGRCVGVRFWYVSADAAFYAAPKQNKGSGRAKSTARCVPKPPFPVSQAQEMRGLGVLR